jgi:hypothetical protein
MLVCINCQEVETLVSKKPSFTYYLNPKFNIPRKLCVCDQCWIEMYKKYGNKNPI